MPGGWYLIFLNVKCVCLEQNKIDILLMHRMSGALVAGVSVFSLRLRELFFAFDFEWCAHSVDVKLGDDRSYVFFDTTAFVT